MQRDKLLEIFVAESEDLLADLEQGLMVLENDAEDEEVINRIFRAAHTLKGNAGMANLDSYVSLAHVMENLLDSVREGSLKVGEELISVLLKSTDALKELTEEVAATGQASLSAEHSQLVEALKSFQQEPEQEQKSANRAATAEPTGPRVFEVSMQFREDLFATGQDPVWLIEELLELGEMIEVKPNTQRIPGIEAIDPETLYLSWKIYLRTERSRSEIKDVFIFVEEENRINVRDVTREYAQSIAEERKLGELLVEAGAVENKDLERALSQQKRVGEILVSSGLVNQEQLNSALKKQKVARKIFKSTSIRVDTRKLDSLVNAVGEMIISVAQVNQKSHELVGEADLVTAIESLEQVSRSLQEQVMSLRMVPVKDTFERFRRPVRDLSNELNKFVLLETKGTETELDKNVIDQLVDPLKHMVRNCVSHGIESPEDRVKAGKSDTGRIELKAAQREGHIVIEIADDGRGIDPEALLQKARSKGLAREDEVPSEREIFDFIFAPGFSTAAQISEISGRGVGLDVVKRNVESLRGSIEVDSELGRGTTFRIRLPLTLAIIDGMKAQVGSTTVSIPLNSVIELIEPSKDVLLKVEGEDFVDVRGEVLPMVHLAKLFNFEPSESKAENKIVVVEDEGRKFGISVDRVLGMEQAVIKPLDQAFSLFERLSPEFTRPSGVAGATILGDGSIGLILDVPGIHKQVAAR